MKYFAITLKTVKTRQTKVIYEVFTAEDLLTATFKLEEFIEGRASDLFNLITPGYITLKNYLGREPELLELGTWNTTTTPWKQVKLTTQQNQVIVDIGSRAGRIHLIELKEQANLFS